MPMDARLLATTLNDLLVLPFTVKVAARYWNLSVSRHPSMDTHRVEGLLAGLNTNAFNLVVDSTGFRGLLPRNLSGITDVCIAGITDGSSLESIVDDAVKLGLTAWVIMDAIDGVPAHIFSSEALRNNVVTSVEVADMLKTNGAFYELTNYPVAALGSKFECTTTPKDHLHSDSDVSPDSDYPTASDKSTDPGSGASHPVERLGRESRYTFPISARRLPVEMCTVCGTRPRYSKGGQSYPTCGYKCAATLGTRNGAYPGMCNVCHERPRHVNPVTARVYPQCGKTCRDRARYRNRNASAQKSSDRTEPKKLDTSCLWCWRTSKQGNAGLCATCSAYAAEQNTPLLLEVPRGHVIFKDVMERFEENWKALAPCPEVRRIYKIQQSHTFLTGFETYQTTINKQLKESMIGVSLSRRQWHGTTRECNLGDSGIQDPCSSQTCLLCSIIRTSFQNAKAGIYTSSTSSKSHLHSNNARDQFQAILLTEVTVGRGIRLMREEVPQHAPSDFDSVRIVTSSQMDDPNPDALVVYNNHAIRLLYLVIYDST